MRSPIARSGASRLLRAFGSLRSWHSLLLLVAVLVAIASGYLAILHERSRNLVVSSATREVEALLAGVDLVAARNAPQTVLDGSIVRVLAADITAPDPSDRTDIARLPTTPGASLAFAWPQSQPTHLRYYRRLSDGGVVVAVHPLDAIAQPINRHLARSYLLTGVILFLFIGGLVWLYRSAQRDIALAYANDPAMRASLLVDAFDSEIATTRRNRLPWLLFATLAIFLFDAWLSVMPLAGALYVAAVVLSLGSTHTWHTMAIAAWTILLSFAGLFISYEGAPLWPSLWPHALIGYFIIGAAAFGISMQRRIRGESLAVARASQAREESEQLRVALARAEAADARMRTALDRLTLATNYAGISVWEWDLVADIIYATEGSDFNQRLGTMTHLRAGDFIRNFVYVDDRDAFAEVFRDALTHSGEGAQISHRYRSVLADGSVQHIQLRARVYYSNGRPTRIVGVDWNITREVEAQDELKRQTEQLRDAERRLERASLSSLEGHWETDLLSGQSWVSSSFAALMGFKPGEFEALHISALDLAHPDDRVRSEAAYLEHLRSGEPYDVRLRMRNARGEYRWYRVQGAAERDAQGRPIRISGAIQNIHAQKLTEDALGEAQARFQRAIAGAQDGLFDYDLVNDTTWFSPRLKKMLGYEEHEFNPKVSELMQHVHPDDVQRTQAAFVATVKGQQPYDLENRLRKKNGEYLWVRGRASAEFGRDGRAIRLSGSLQDITEARAAREELLHVTAAAEAANAAKSAFLATMSHEIRTPMNGIIGMTELLLDTKLDRTQREYASIIRGSADSLLHVINDVLDFSKIEAGKMEIEAIDMDLRSLIEDVCSLMALQAAAKDVELIVDIRAEVPDAVRGDALRIRQCLLNLLNNAVKFTTRGEIVVEVSVIAQQDGKALIQFQVQDTGIGMSSEQTVAIFQPFVQADSSTTRRFGGTGLGLSIVKKLVELMGGQVGVESRAGVGSTFWFVLPLQPIESTGQFARLNVSGAGRRILVVDDNETNRNVLGAQLARAGYVVESCGDGAAALHVLRDAKERDQAFDVALVDFQMPTMDGAMFGEIVNADKQLSATRLVLLSSLDSGGERSRFSGIGFAAYLAKPVRLRELIKCLQQVLASDAREWHMQSQPMVTRNLLSGDATSSFHGRVLVAEDNEVNRKVAHKFLERLGCSVRVVENGAQCVAALREERFDLVLMDMQMPELDGLEATRQIRAEEHGGKRTPIVALTANVMPGQVERCLDAGMDDFLGKPIDVDRLRDVLERFGLGADIADVVEEKRSASAAETAIDWQRVEELSDNDATFAHELLQTFVSSADTIIGELRLLAEREQRDELARAAHKLKGASGNIGAHRLSTLAHDLERKLEHLAAGDIRSMVHAIAEEERRVRAEIHGRRSKAH